MILKKIRLKNIRSYENGELVFPEGSTLLSGDIGSGKTTILMAIEFALFGLQPGQKGTSLLKNSEGEGLVELELEIDGKSLTLKRCLKRGKSVTQDSASIAMQGMEKEMPVSELKNLVLNLLNYPTELSKRTNLLYKFTVYTPQEEMKQIITEDTETRLNTLRYIFGVDKYKRIRENTLLYTTKLREKIRNKEALIQDIPEKANKILEKEHYIIEVSTRVASAEKELVLQRKEKKKVEALLEEIEEKIEEKRNLDKEIEKTKVLIAGKKETLLSLGKEENYIKKQIKETESLALEEYALQKINDAKTIKMKEEEALRKEFMEISGLISSLQLKVQEAARLREQILKLQLCPTCLQNVDNKYKENVIAKLDLEEIECKTKTEALVKKKEDLVREIETLKEAILSLDKQYQELQIIKVKIESLKEKKTRLKEIENSMESIQEDIKLLESHLTTLKDSLLNFATLEALHKTRKQEFDLALTREKNAEIKIAEFNKEIEITRQHIADLQEEIREKEKIKREMQFLAELEQWLSEQFLEIVSFIEKNIMLKLRDEFSRLFNQWFSLLVQDSFIVRLDEDFTPIIEQQDYELDYTYLSGGERTAVALAYRLALCQVINSMLSSIKTRDMIILDEPTDGFSEQQLDKMRDIFQQLKVKQLIIVSHEQKIEGFVENIIKCRKENGITKIEV